MHGPVAPHAPAADAGPGGLGRDRQLAVHVGQQLRQQRPIARRRLDRAIEIPSLPAVGEYDDQRVLHQFIAAAGVIHEAAVVVALRGAETAPAASRRRAVPRRGETRSSPPPGRAPRSGTSAREPVPCSAARRPRCYRLSPHPGSPGRGAMLRTGPRKTLPDTSSPSPPGAKVTACSALGPLVKMFPRTMTLP